MNSWLKLIGSSDRPLTDHPWYGNFKDVDIGFRKARVPGIRNGDHLFLYAPGGSKSVFALAEAITDPEHDTAYNSNKEGSCRWKIRINYIFRLPVALGVSIDEISLPIRNLSRSVCQQSHIKLFPEEYTNAYNRLQEKYKAYTS